MHVSTGGAAVVCRTAKQTAHRPRARKRDSRHPHNCRGWRANALIAVLVPLVLSAAATASPPVPMSLPGTFDVNAHGAATYSIAIDVPPGTAGMAPSLTLNYNSQQRDGMLGMGWTLGGLSQIGRCAQTVVQDGTRGGINYDTNDRFCLDGARLMAINGGSYGADGTEYRTEVDSFSRIISHGTAGTGPAWFEVHTKAGQIMQFGNTSDSQILVVGQATARAWAVNQVSDPKGNYLSVTYTQDTTNGQAYPASIAYTGNATAGLQPYNSVQFGYVTKPIAPTFYQAGAPIRTTQLLASMQTFAGSALVGNYQLTYQQGASTNRSRLTSVQKCGGDGACLPATTFGWTDSTNSVVVQTNLAGMDGNTSYGQGLSSLLGLADFNGDGKTDLLWDSTNGDVVWLSNPSGGLTVGPANPNAYAPVIGDFNGDGLADLFWQYNNNNLWLSNGDGTFSISNPSLPPSSQCTSGSMTFVADFNGDGRADILWVCQQPGFRELWLSNGDGTFTVVTNLAGLDGQYVTSPITLSGGISSGCAWFPQVADLNGDGKADIFWDCETTAYPGISGGLRMAWLSNGDGTFQVITNLGGLDGSFGYSYNPTGLSSGWAPIVSPATDFNGDGKADIFWNYVYDCAPPPTRCADGARAAWISKGDGTFEVVTNLAGQDGNYGIVVNNDTYNGWIPHFADLNGDGRADILWDYVTPNGESIGQRIAWLSNGDGTFAVIDNFGGLGGSYASGWTYE
jgi:hypothetical protein